MLQKIGLLLLITILLISCSKENYGGSIDPNAPLVKVKDIFFTPSLKNTKVNVKGIIITQCQSSGCWFFINDGTGQIFINLAPKGFVLPPRTGKQAMVTGIVSEQEQNRVIIAEAVQLY